MRIKTALRCQLTSNLVWWIWKAAVVYLMAVLVIVRFNLRHSIIDRIVFSDTKAENSRLVKENFYRYHRAVHTIKMFNNTTPLSHSVSKHTTSAGQNSEKIGITVTITTVTRNSANADHLAPNYLTQTVAAFLQMMNRTDFVNSKFFVKLYVCNTDLYPKSHVEMQSLPSWITVFEKFPNRTVRQTYVPSSRKNKRKEDHIFCLEQSLDQQTPFLLMVEDDALPRAELFDVINARVFESYERTSYPSKVLENITFIKFYHPERLLGFIALDTERLPDLIAISALLTSVYMFAYIKFYIPRNSILKVWLYSYMFIVVFVIFIGRPTFTELRRFSTYFYQITPSPSCCTQAVLYSREGARTISEYLKTVNCSPRFPTDTAIDTVVRDRGLVTKLIQPNLFDHIGHFSSLGLKYIDPFLL